MSRVALLTLDGAALSPATIRAAVAALSDAERAAFARTGDPRRADLRAVLRAAANRRRAAGAAVSVAHAGRFGVLAFADGDCVRLGVDCEPWIAGAPDIGWVREIALPHEYDAWLALPEAARGAAFTRMWVLKEAGFKAGAASRVREVAVTEDFSRLAVPGYVSAFAADSPAHAIAAVVRGVSPVAPEAADPALLRTF